MGAVTRPSLCATHKGVFGGGAREIVDELRLYVALEHFQGEHHVVATESESSEGRFP